MPCAGQVSTVPGSFTQLDFDCGGYVSGFAAHASGRVYCKANVGGLYRSDDHGKSWRWLSADMPGVASQMPQGLAVMPSNPDVVIQSTGTSYVQSDPSRGIWKSQDGGATWRQTLSGVNFSGNDEAQYGGPSLVSMPDDERELWTISRGDGLWKSMDSGDTWSRVDGAFFTGKVGCCLCPSARFPDQLWLGCEGGVYFSSDRGKTWIKVRDMGRCFRVLRFADGTALVSGGDSGQPRLYRVTCGDWSRPDPSRFMWKDLSESFSGAWGELPLLTILADESVSFAGSNMATWTSADKGKTWKKIEPTLDLSGGQPIWQRPGETQLLWGRNEIVQDPSNPRRLFMGSGLNALVSEDLGRTWRNSFKGIGMVCCYKAEFSRDRPGLVFVPSMDQHCMVITDGGSSGSASYCLAAFSKTAGVSSGAKILLGGDKARLLMTRYGTDGARIAETGGDLSTLELWTERKPNGLPAAAFVDGFQDRDDPLEYLIVAGGSAGPGRGGIYRTTNGGKTFTQCAGLPLGLNMGYYWSINGYNSLYDDPDNPERRYYLSNGAGFFRSEDRGKTWKKTGKGLLGLEGQLARDSNGTLWAAMGNAAGALPKHKGLYCSLDGGDTWSLKGDFEFLYPRVDAVGGRIAVFGKRAGDEWDGIWLSLDSGETWGRVDRPGQRFPTVNGLALDPSEPRKLWISTNGRSVSVFTDLR
jgi:photosystem II stability/assembly factor-like uncharacterized protein